MKVVILPVEEILSDFFFCFSSASDISCLKRSILASGIRTPLHVISAQQSYRLLSGFKRFRAAVELGLKELPAVVLSEKKPLEEIFREVLLEHLTHRSLSIVEKARVIRILEELHISWEMQRKDFLDLLEVPERKEVVQEIKAILQFFPKLQEYIEMYDLSLKQTEPFQKLSSNEQELFVDLAMKLQIRSVELSDIVSMVCDISGRDGIPIEEVFEGSDIPSILESEEFSRNEKISRIKERLKRWRFPHLTSWNEKLKNLKREMGLPSKVQLLWDSSLEKQGIEIRLEIHSVRDVEEFVTHLSKKENQKKLEEVLKIV